MLTYKRKLILTKAQISRVNSWIGACRVVYNMGLEIRISAYKNKQQSVSCYDLQKQLPTIKDIDWIKDVPSQSLQNAIERLESAYKKFFAGGGFPRYSSKKDYNSILMKSVEVDGNFATLPKLGKVKMFKDAAMLGTPKTATIIKEPTGYFICVTTDTNKDIQNNDESQVVGLDVGVSFFCVNSDGEFVQNPKHFRKYERNLRIAAKSLSRKKKRSNRWKKQVMQNARLHHKVSNTRKDFLHKESTKIAKQFHTVIVEDLKINNMTKKAKPKKDESGKYVKNNAAAKSGLNKSILDCGWGMFRKMLEYKTNVIRVNPKYTSQTCNECGTKGAKSRVSQSKFKCSYCGHETNADENAAKNIKQVGEGIALNRQRKAIVYA